MQESIDHRLSEGEPLRIHTTIHRGTAPNDIDILVRLNSKDSGTFSRQGTFTRSLHKVSAIDRRLCTQIGSNAFSFNTDWLRILQPRLFFTSLQLLNQTSRRLHEISRSPAPATWVTNSPWYKPTSSTTTTLSFVLSDECFFSIKLKHVAIRLSNYCMEYLHTLSLTLNFLNSDKIVCQQNHQRDISRIRWGIELKVSSFQSFDFLSFLDTYIFYITSIVTWLHHSTLPSRLTPQRNSRLKRNLRNVSVFASSLHKSLFGSFGGFYQQT